MAELSSHSSGEAISDSVIQEGDWLDGEAETIKKRDLPDASSSGKSTANSSTASKTAIVGASR